MLMDQKKICGQHMTLEQFIKKIVVDNVQGLALNYLSRV